MIGDLHLVGILTIFILFQIKEYEFTSFICCYDYNV